MRGEVLSHYRIAEEVGSGGMGTVYKAEDLRLKRTVALKFLAVGQMGEEEPKARFLHEARAAAALDHPNICGVYEIDHVDDRLFMALPFLDGECLDKRIEQGPLPIPDFLRIAIQVAAALEEAHSKGIVHRDIKPGNVMLQRKGGRLHCVLMDFGLARLAQSTKLTRVGSQMGTATYMSPEQVEGAEVDRRTDIWSLGVMLYEMTAGSVPFPSDYEQAQFYAILNESPEPLSSLRTGVPRELERIVEKCMAKVPDERYQTCTDLIVDLRSLQRGVSSGTTRITALSSSSARATHNEPPQSSRSNSTWMHLGTAVAIGAILAGTAVWLTKPSTSTSDWVPQYEVLRMTWDSGLSMTPSISRDGRLVAYSSDRDGGGHLDIWVEQTSGGGRVQVTGGDTDDMTPVLSPDSSTVAFYSDSDLYVVPSLGGTVRFLAADGSHPAFSPDGKSISFASSDGRLMVVDVNGGKPREIQAGLDLVQKSLWLPDGKHLLFAAFESAHYDWWVTSVDGGKRIPTDFLNFQRSARGLTRLRSLPAWLEPGQWIVFSSDNGLWRVPIASAPWRYTDPPEALGFGTWNLTDLSVADDGTIALGETDSDTRIWSVPISSDPKSSLDSSLLSPTEPTSLSLSLATNRLAYVGRTGDFWADTTTTDVYVRDLATGAEANITGDRNREHGAVISPDGLHVAYESRLGLSIDSSEIRVYSFSTGQSRVLCEKCGAPNSWSSDNRHLLAGTGNPRTISRISVADGEQSELIRLGEGRSVDSARISPDGQWIAFSAQDDSGRFSRVLMARASARSPISESDAFAITDQTHRDATPRWSPDGRTLYFLSNRSGPLDIWSVPLGPDKRPKGEPRPARLFDASRFSMAAIAVSTSYDEIDYAIGLDRIYFTLREITGRIYLMRPKDTLEASVL